MAYSDYWPTLTSLRSFFPHCDQIWPLKMVDFDLLDPFPFLDQTGVRKSWILADCSYAAISAESLLCAQANNTYYIIKLKLIRILYKCSLSFSMKRDSFWHLKFNWIVHDHEFSLQGFTNIRMFLISDYVCIYINLLIVQSIWIHIKVSSFQYSLLKNGGLKNGGICLYDRHILYPFQSDVSVGCGKGNTCRYSSWNHDDYNRQHYMMPPVFLVFVWAIEQSKWIFCSLITNMFSNSQKS